MRKPRILRVGICGCPSAGFYRGALDGQRISVRQLADGSLCRPHEFVFREVSIPDNGQWYTVLRARRCHFLLDLHRQERQFLAELDGIYLAFNGKNRLPKLQFGRYLSSGRGGWFARVWRSKRLPSAPQITAAIRRLIGRLDRPQLRYWLDQGRLPKAAFHLG